MPLKESEHAQYELGPSDIFAANAYGNDAIACASYTGPRRSSRILYEPEWIAFNLPLSWSGDFIYNGRLAEERDLMVATSPDGHYLAGGQRTLMGVALRKNRVVEIARALSGRPDDDIPLPDLHVRLDPRTWSTARTGLSQAIASSSCSASGHGRTTLPEAVNDTLACGFADLLLPHIMPEPRETGERGALQVVHAAQSAYEDLPVDRVTLETLCRYAGVGKVWLHKCFVQVHGVSPMAYQRTRRMTEARLRLVDRDAPPRSVKDVALSLGFLKPGRFASDYKKMFGELPSDTLERARLN